MSSILNEAVLKALRNAYSAYMRLDRKDFMYHIRVAENGIEAIESLGHDPERGRELEVLFLKGERNLMLGFAYLKQPHELLQLYELAATQLAFPPSRVLTREMAFLPPRADLAEIFRVPLQGAEEAAASFTAAVDLYGRLTDGGGVGADLLYAAEVARSRGDLTTLEDLLRSAMRVGGEWIIPHVENMSKQCE